MEIFLRLDKLCDGLDVQAGGLNISTQRQSGHFNILGFTLIKGFHFPSQNWISIYGQIILCFVLGLTEQPTTGPGDKPCRDSPLKLRDEQTPLSFLI